MKSVVLVALSLFWTVCGSNVRDYMKYCWEVFGGIVEDIWEYVGGYLETILEGIWEYFGIFWSILRRYFGMF